MPQILPLILAFVSSTIQFVSKIFTIHADRLIVHLRSTSAKKIHANEVLIPTARICIYTRTSAPVHDESHGTQSPLAKSKISHEDTQATKLVAIVYAMRFVCLFLE